jgi:hypothetical protein
MIRAFTLSLLIVSAGVLTTRSASAQRAPAPATGVQSPAPAVAPPAAQPPQDAAHRFAEQDRPRHAYLPGPGPAPAGYQPLKAAPTVGSHVSIQVNVDDCGHNIPGDAANEPSLAVDPTDPNRLVIGWRQFDNVQSDFRQAGWGVSTDGGRSWDFRGVLQPGVFGSDPVLAADADGVLYYATLDDPATFGIHVYRSTDGGESWGSPAAAGAGDKEWIVIDRTAGFGKGFLYEAWQIASPLAPNQFTRSIDGGDSFQAASLLSASTPIFGTLAVASDGGLFVSGATPSFSEFHVLRSNNAQLAAVVPTTFPLDALVDLNGRMVLDPPVNPVGLAGQAWVATQPVGDDVYLLCSVDPPGDDPLDVYFARSPDGGLSWAPPVRVNDDVGTNAFQWFGTLSVAPNGRLDAVWNDTRNDADPSAPDTSELFYAFSTNGGGTWSANQPVSPAFEHFVGYPQQQKIGDYYQTVSDKVGVHVAYAATHNGEQDVWYLRIGGYDCNDNGIDDALDIAGGTPDANGNGIPDSCEELVALAGELDIKPGSCPNPFNLKSNGKLPVALAGTAGFVVAQVKQSTLRLGRADGKGGSVPPIEGPPGPHTTVDDVATPFAGALCDCHDAGGDGTNDLVMHFDTQTLVDELGLECFEPGEAVALALTGELENGSAFVATDCIVIVPGSAQPALHVMADGGSPWIDATPLDLYADGGGFAPFTRGYFPGTTVLLSAPPVEGGRDFLGWRVNGRPDLVESPVLPLPVATQDQSVEAVYSRPAVAPEGAVPVVPGG